MSLTQPEDTHSAAWRLKERLQFSGWLQYFPNAAAALVCFVLAWVGWLIGAFPAVLFWPPFIAGALLTVVFFFDVSTVKFGFRPTERIPAPKAALDAFDLMRSRVSCRSFQARDLTAAHRDEILEAVRRETRPEALLGTRPIRFEYVAAPLTVWPVVGAHEFLVAIGPREYDRLATIDVGRSLQKVVLDATRLGLATCWIGPGANHTSVEHHLGARFDPARDHVICVCALGYPSWFRPLLARFMPLLQHHRLPLASLFFADPTFRAPLDVKAPRFERFGRCYEVCQWSPSSFNAQPTRCAAVVEGEAVVRFDFCAATTSRFYAAVALGIWCANWETGCAALGIPGHFSVLSAEERKVPGAPALPRYDVSWVCEQLEG